MRPIPGCGAAAARCPAGSRRCSPCWRAGAPTRRFDRLLTEAERPEVLWQASATLGEVRFGERRFVQAAMAFDRAIEIMKNETRTPDRALEIRDRRPDRSGRAGAPARRECLSGRRRAASCAPRAINATASLAASIRLRFAASFRAPSRCRSRSNTPRRRFTSVGEEAARELLSAIKEQQPGRIMLVGTHRRARLGRDQHETVLCARRSGGCVPARERRRCRRSQPMARVANEPIRLNDTSGLTQEDIYALNRRVEWRRD